MMHTKQNEAADETLLQELGQADPENMRACSVTRFWAVGACAAAPQAVGWGVLDHSPCRMTCYELLLMKPARRVTQPSPTTWPNLGTSTAGGAPFCTNA